VTEGLDTPLNRLVIADNNTDWVYSLFPSLLFWRIHEVPVQVLLPEYGDREEHGPYRRKLLRALGAQVIELSGKSSVPVRAYILDTKDPARINAIVRVKRGLEMHGIEAIHYNGFLHSSAIQSMLQLLDDHLGQPMVAPTNRPSIVAGRQGQLIDYLVLVGQYSKGGVSVQVENIPLDRLVSLTRLVREYKYKQIHHLIGLYSRHDIPLFAPAFVKFYDGKDSILTPPVVEESGGQFILIEGSTRAVYCRDSGVHGSVKCVVVRNVRDPLPSQTIPFSQVRVVGRTLAAAERYDGFTYDNFRAIENTVHPLASLD